MQARSRGHKEKEKHLQPKQADVRRPVQLPPMPCSLRAFLLCLAPLLGLFSGLGWLQALGSGLGWAFLEACLGIKGAKLPCFGLRLITVVMLSMGWCSFLDPTSPPPSPARTTYHSHVPLPEMLRPMKFPEPPSRVSTLSVVVPCANESDFVAKTIEAIFKATAPEELEEIIVIDDASEPPILSELSVEFLEKHKATVQRYDRPQGLIRAKIHGADASTGDVIVFLDCHVKPMEDWTKSILANINENVRRVVVPYITSLDPDTWEEVSPDGGGKKMCLTWNADFIWCNEYPGPYVPIMSGGLLALSKFWWEASGGYDENMLAWGGENLDQSLRTWLCGGEIVVAEGSRVAHMWRDLRKPKTQLRYSIPSDAVRRNRLRAVDAWLGPWAAKVRTFPEFEDFQEGGPLDIGSLESIERYRDTLECQGFDSYLDRFRDLYVGTGRLPAQVFHIQEAVSGLCMELDVSKHDSESGRIIMAPCDRNNELQRFHDSNSVSGTSECCSGLKVWDFSFCVAAYEIGGGLNADACELGGDTPAQHLRFDQSGSIRWEPGAGLEEEGCLAPREAPQVPAEPGAFLSFSSGCRARVRFEGTEQGMQRFKVVSAGLCLSWAYARDYGGQLAFVACVANEETQLFAISHVFADTRVQVITNHGLCVDAKHGAGPVITWPCDPVELENANQIFFLRDNGLFSWRHSHSNALHCVDIATTVVLSTCRTMADGGVPAGQMWLPGDLRTDGSFVLHISDTDYCLGYIHQEHSDSVNLFTVPCSDALSIRWIEEGGRLRNLGADLCMDSNDMVSPLLYTCYDFGERPHLQRFQVNESGAVSTPRTWADNGRKRYPAKCLDGRPAPLVDVAAQPCAEIDPGTRWSRIWEERPLETRLFLEAGGRLETGGAAAEAPKLAYAEPL